MKQITTFQKDVKTGYRYKRAPTHLRRKWKSKSRSWIQNMLKNVASRKYHYSGTANWATAAGRQNWFGFVNYGMKGVGGYDGTGDISDIWTRINLEERPMVSAGQGQARTVFGNEARRMYFDSNHVKCTLTNTGTGTIYWEVFECFAREDMPMPNNADPYTLETYFDECWNSQHQAVQVNASGLPGAPNPFNQTSGNSVIDHTFSGVTPFQSRYFCQKWKITKTTKLQAEAGRSISFECGTPKNYTLKWDDCDRLQFKKGVSKMMVIRQYGANVSDPIGVAATSAVFDIQKDYNVKILDKTLPQVNYYNYTNSTP